MKQHPFENSSTDADSTIVAFDYQFYYFLSVVLNLEQGQTAAYEVGEDVWVQHGDGSYSLIQLKHSNVEAKFTDLDSDLWKTISNWIELLDSSKEGSKVKRLLIVTNKQIGSRNKLVPLLSAFQIGKIPREAVEDYLCKLVNKTEDMKIRFWIESLLVLEEVDFERIVSMIEVAADEEDVLMSAKEVLMNRFFVRDSRVDDVFRSIDGVYREDVFAHFKGRKKYILSFDDFKEIVSPLIENARLESLPIRRELPTLPPNPLDQFFLKELIAIGDISDSDKIQIEKMTLEKLLLANNLEAWKTKRELSPEELLAFENDAIAKWTNCHRKKHRKTKKCESGTGIQEVDCEQALECLDEVREIEMVLKNMNLGTQLSNGKFYLLADNMRIGWILSWSKRYQ